MIEGDFYYKSVASGGSVTSAGSQQFYVNSGNYEKKAEAYGVKFTGLDADATDNWTNIQGAIDSLGTAGGGRLALASDGHLKVDKPLQFRDNVIIDGRGCLVENIRTSEPSSGDLSTRCFQMGSFARLDSDDFTFQTCSAVTAGQEYFTPASTSGFQIGDSVYLVKANSSFGNGTTALPDDGIVRCRARYLWGECLS